MIYKNNILSNKFYLQNKVFILIYLHAILSNYTFSTKLPFNANSRVFIYTLRFILTHIKAIKNFTNNFLKNSYSHDFLISNKFKLNYSKRKNEILLRTLRYLNLFPTTKVSRTGASPYFKKFYTLPNSNSSTILNLRKFFKSYNSSFSLVYNIFLLELPILYFSSPSFRKEIDIMNWCFNSHLKMIWRLINPIFTSNTNTMTNDLLPTLKLATYTGFNIAIITDTMVHRNTLYYTRRCNFYTIGLVPIDSYVKNVDFAIPTSQYNLLTQSVFHSFVIYIKKLVIKDQFSKKYHMWYSYIK